MTLGLENLINKSWPHDYENPTSLLLDWTGKFILYNRLNKLGAAEKTTLSFTRVGIQGVPGQHQRNIRALYDGDDADDGDDDAEML
eukprot:8812279-Karenia_brevis.AAC.1